MARAEPPAVEAVDGTGAGDAFTAAMVSGVSQGTLETVADLVGARVFGKAASKLVGKGAAKAAVLHAVQPPGELGGRVYCDDGEPV